MSAKPLTERTRIELFAVARRAPAIDVPGPPVDPESGEREREPTPDEVKAFVTDTERPVREVLKAIVAALPDAELAALPEVKGHRQVREHRADLEAAALGELVEAEREEAARALAGDENDGAPTQEELERQAAPPDAWDPRVAQTEGDPVAAARWRFLYEHGDAAVLERELAKIMQAQADEGQPPAEGDPA